MEVDTHHLQEHRRKKRCPHCQKFFSQATELESHIRSHIPTLDNHLKNHSKRQASMCHRCGEMFFSQRKLLGHLKTHEEQQKHFNVDKLIDCKDRVFKEENGIPFKLKPARGTELVMKSNLNNKRINDFGDRECGTLHEVVSIHYPTNTSVIYSSFTDSVCKIANDLPIVMSKEQRLLKKEHVEVLGTPIDSDITVRKDTNVDYRNSMIKLSNESPSDTEQSCHTHSWKEPHIEFEVTVKNEKPDVDHSLSKITNEPLSDGYPSFHQFQQDYTKTVVGGPPVGFDITIKEEKSDDHLSTFDKSKQDSVQKSLKVPTVEFDITVKQDKFNEDKIKNEPISDDEPISDNELPSDDERLFEQSRENSTDSFPCRVAQCEAVFRHGRNIVKHYSSQHCTANPPFNCPLCAKVFQKKPALRKHMKYHLTFKCQKCRKRFNRECALKAHSKTHKTFKEYKCSICPKVYLSYSGRFSHMKSHEDIKELQCYFCGKQFQTNCNLQRHQDSVHSGRNASEQSKSVVDDVNSSKETNCFNEKRKEIRAALDNQQVQPVSDQSSLKESPVGFDIITKQEELEDDHSNLKITNRPLSDNELSFDQPKQDSTQRNGKELSVGLDISVKEEKSDNIESIFRITNEPLSDDEQSFDGFEKDSNRKTHKKPPVGFDITFIQEMPGDINSTFNTTNEPFSEDEETFAQSAGARYASFPCAVSECKEKFKYHRDIINHYLSQHDVGSSPFKCPVCEKVVTEKLEVRSHLKSHVAAEYKCDHCPRISKYLQNLKRHIKTHTGERPYECPKCLKRFRTRSALTVHIKTHNNDKGYKCSLCTKEFYSRNGLILHAKSHTVIKELQCNFCGRQFPVKSRLQRHLKGACGNRTLPKTSNES